MAAVDVIIAADCCNDGRAHGCSKFGIPQMAHQPLARAKAVVKGAPAAG